MKLANKFKFGNTKRTSDTESALEYLNLLTKQQPLTLRKRCFISIICSSEDKSHLAQLPLELKEELIHFMLDYRLFSTKIAPMAQLVEILMDPRIKSLDLSTVKNKVSQTDSVKDLLRAAHRLQRLDFSYCYEINDQILKLIPNTSSGLTPGASAIRQRNSSVSAADTGSYSGSGGSVSSPVISPSSTPTPTPPATPTKNKLLRLQRLKDKILKKKFLDPFRLSLGEPEDYLPPPAIVIPLDHESTSSGAGNSSNGGFYEDSGLESFSIRQCTAFSDNILRRLLKASPSLTHLDLTGTKISGKTLQVITNHCLKLRSLSIGSLSESIISPAITSSFCNLVNLTSLDLSYNPKLDHNVLVSILTNHNHTQLSNSSSTVTTPIVSPALTPTGPHPPNIFISGSSININGMSTASSSSLSSFGIDHSISHHSFSSMISGASSLSINTNRLDEAHNIVIVYPSMLQRLNLSHLDIDDESLAILPKKCPLLHTLDISYCTKISDDGLADMTTNGLITLQSLTAKVAKVSSGFVNIFKTNPLLHKLDIRFTQVQDQQLNEISTSLNNLRVLRLDGTPISNTVFRAISASNRCLEQVGLSQCKNITFEIFNVLADNCKMIKKLYLSHCRMGPMNLEAATNFFNKSKLLTTLDVSFSPMASDDFLMAMANSNCAANLESLLVGGGFQQLDGVTVTRLVDRCPSIRVFSCLSCFKAKDNVIIDAMKRWLLLEAIELTDCTGLTTNVLTFLTLETHIHHHLRFIFFGSALSDEVDEQSILSKIDGRTTIEVLETQQQVTLEDIIEQGWITL